MQQGLSNRTATCQVRDVLTAHEVALLISRYQAGVQIKSSGRYRITPQQAVQNVSYLLQLLRDVPEVRQQVDNSFGAAVRQQQQKESLLSPASAMQRMLEEAAAWFEAAAAAAAQQTAVGACCESDVPFIASRLRSAAAIVGCAGGASSVNAAVSASLCHNELTGWGCRRSRSKQAQQQKPRKLTVPHNAGCC